MPALSSTEGALALRQHAAPAPMEMEEGRDAEVGEKAPKDAWHKCFPMRLCCCMEVLPPTRMLIGWLPDTFIVIQDWTHMFCALGMLSQLGLVVVSIVNIAHFKLAMVTMSKLWCTREAVTFVLVITIFPYCFQVIQRYDGALMDKKEEQRREKEKLQKEYENLFDDMNSRIEAFAEFSAGYATKIFDGKMRDLSKWAKRVGADLERETKMMSDVDKDEFKEEFIGMLMNFARVIQECGVDPVEHPVILYKREELVRLETFKEIADLVVKRCSQTKSSVQVAAPERGERVGGWPEKTKGECPKCKKIWSVSQARTHKGKCKDCSGKAVMFAVRLNEIPAWDLSRPGQCGQCKEWFTPEQALDCNGVCPKCPGEIFISEVKQLNTLMKEQEKKFETDKKHARNVNKRLSDPVEGQHSSRLFHVAGAGRKPCCPTWISCGRCGCSSVPDAASKDGWPSQYACLCIHIKIFSKEHVKLMFGFLLCLVLIGLHTGWLTERSINEKDADMLERHRVGYVLLSFCVAMITANLFILLVRFEDIDLVQQLTRDIQVLKNENEKVENTREEVQDTYGKLQDLNDVWLNRTIPRLELVARTAEMIADMPEKASKGEWALCNHAIKVIFRRVIIIVIVIFWGAGNGK